MTRNFSLLTEIDPIYTPLSTSEVKFLVGSHLKENILAGDLRKSVSPRSTTSEFDGSNVFDVIRYMTDSIFLRNLGARSQELTEDCMDIFSECLDIDCPTTIDNYAKKIRIDLARTISNIDVSEQLLDFYTDFILKASKIPK